MAIECVVKVFFFNNVSSIKNYPLLLKRSLCAWPTNNMKHKPAKLLLSLCKAITYDRFAIVHRVFLSISRIKKRSAGLYCFAEKKATKQNHPKQRQFGAAKGFVVMADDFDEPLEDFKDYM